MIRTKGGLVFVGLCYMPLPAFLVHINGTFGAVINMSSGFLATDRTFHDSLPPLSLSFFLNPS
jgi:hypothetical protein